MCILIDQVYHRGCLALLDWVWQEKTRYTLIDDKTAEIFLYLLSNLALQSPQYSSHFGRVPRVTLIVRFHWIMIKQQIIWFMINQYNIHLNLWWTSVLINDKPVGLYILIYSMLVCILISDKSLYIQIYDKLVCCPIYDKLFLWYPGFYKTIIF